MKQEKRMRSGRLQRNAANILRQAFMLFGALLVLLPLYFTLITSLKTQQNYSRDKFGFPDPIYTGNIQTALRGGRYFLWFKNSVILSGGAVLLSTSVSALAAFSFARMRFSGRNSLLSIVTAMMVIPPVVMLIPLFLLFQWIGLTGSRPPMGVYGTASNGCRCSSMPAA